MKPHLLLLALASCTHDITVVDRVEVSTARELDVLYVFDNSGDRGRYDAMASQTEDMLSRLQAIDGQLPSLHVGWVTTDLGTRGALDTEPGPQVGNCIGNGQNGTLGFPWGLANGEYLEDLRGADGARTRNYAGDDLAFEVGRMTNPDATLASAGCEFEQPLEAMKRALDPALNPGFVRPGAMLSVVFLTTEDDCSFARSALLDPADGSLGPLTSFRCTEQGVVCDQDPRAPGTHTNCRPREGSELMVDVSAYDAYLAQLKPDRGDIVVSAVAGHRSPFQVINAGLPTLAPSCSGPGGIARPAVRLATLVDSFGGAFVDGCTQADAAAKLAQPIVERQRTCFANLTAADGEACTVVETVEGVATELPACADGGTGACWTIYEDADACPAGGNLGISIDRRASTAPAASRIEANCNVSAT